MKIKFCKNKKISSSMKNTKTWDCGFKKDEFEIDFDTLRENQ